VCRKRCWPKLYREIKSTTDKLRECDYRQQSVAGLVSLVAVTHSNSFCVEWMRAAVGGGRKARDQRERDGGLGYCLASRIQRTSSTKRGERKLSGFTVTGTGPATRPRMTSSRFVWFTSLFQLVTRQAAAVVSSCSYLICCLHSLALAFSTRPGIDVDCGSEIGGRCRAADSECTEKRTLAINTVT
jgi:hypothetical protein